MKKSAGLYLSAREASAELAISPATLYAYVSRGLIRSEPSSDSRSHRYRAEDVRGAEGTARAVAGAARLAQFRRRFAGDGFGDLDHHRGRPDLSRRQLHRPGRNRHARTCRDAAVGRHRRRSVCAGQLPDDVGRDAAVADAARDAAPIDRTIAVLALAASADPRAFTRAAEGRAMVGGRIMRLVVATMLNRRAVGDAAASADRQGMGAGQQARRRSDPPGAGAAGGSRTERLDLHRALRGIDRAQSLRCDDRRPGGAERPEARRRRGAGGAARARRWSMATSPR